MRCMAAVKREMRRPDCGAWDEVDASVEMGTLLCCSRKEWYALSSSSLSGVHSRGESWGLRSCFFPLSLGSSSSELT